MNVIYLNILKLDIGNILPTNTIESNWVRWDISNLTKIPIIFTNIRQNIFKYK